MTVTYPYANPQSYQQWASDLIAGSGGQLPNTPQEITLISAWEQSENPVSQVGSYTSHGGFNALNTSLKTGSSGLEPGSTFIPTFPTIDAAISATLSTLRQSNYAPELTALEQQSNQGLVDALGSPGHLWGSSPSLVASILHTGPSTASAGGNPGGPAQGATATLASAPGGALDPLNWPGEIGAAGGSAIASGVLGVIKVITAPLRHFVEDAGLVVLGVILFAVAIVVIAHSAGSSGSSSAPAPAPQSAPEGDEEEHEEEREPEEHEAPEEHEEAPREEHEERAPAPRRDAEGHRETQALEHEAERAPAAAAAVAAA